jgi:hypothetical protein
MTSTPTLADLIREVLLDGPAGPRDPIRQIGEAERLAGELSHLGEGLVNFFVEQARADGLSWADIGAPRGLSRQGVQQRYTPFLAHLTMADLVEAGAQPADTHATRLGRDTIDSGDLLLGVLDDGGSAVAAVRELGIDPGVLRSELERAERGAGAGAGGATGAAEGTPATAEASAAASAPVSAGAVATASPLGPEARRALDGAVSEARGHLVALGHLLLGVLRNPAGRAGQVLMAHGVTKSTPSAAASPGNGDDRGGPVDGELSRRSR